MTRGDVPPLRGEWARRTIALVLTLVLVPAAVGAQDVCAVRAGERSSRVNAGTWSPPLDRLLTLSLHDVSLRDALDRWAEGARVRLSYSGDLLPLDRRVCVSWSGVAAGDALVDLVGANTVEPLAAGSDQVVLAPVRRQSMADTRPLTTSDIGLLQRVVITSSSVAMPQRAMTIAMDVLKGPALARQGVTSVSQMVDGAVPGIWLWNQSPSNLLARYGSIRGASSFGLSYPKMYIDGIEVANPLLVTHFSPELVDRIEVIRGPQGAALYGSDAISGVVNVFLRHEGADADGERLQLQTGAGLTESRFAPHAVLAQEHSLTLRTGDLARSASLAISGSSLGDFMPNAFTRELRGAGTMRMIRSRSTVTGTARLYAKEAGLASNPLLSGVRAAPSLYGTGQHRIAGTGAMSDTVAVMAVADSSPQTMQQYTFGATAIFAQSDRWTHTVVAGIDGYRLTNVPDELSPIPSPMDSALRAARGGGDRTTLRATSVAHLFGTSDDRVAATVTFGAEHSLLRQETVANANVARVLGAALADATVWSSSAGLTAQGSASLDDALFLTTGLRLERDGQAGFHQTALLPTIGVATVRNFGGVATKLRGAYGRGIRTARTATREAAMLGMRYAAGPELLAPEQQAGTEVGADVMFGRGLGIHVTRFDQRAYGLIQPVMTGASVASSVGTTARVTYALQNVGEIANHGWELQSSLTHGRLVLEGALSLVDSRVQRLASGYTGDLRAGDRMLAVPARTGSMSATWTGMRWFASVTAMRATDWLNYDRLGLAQLLADTSRVTPMPRGEALRSYWRRYPGVTRLRGNFSRDLKHGLAFTLMADNLLNQQRGEPDDVTVLPGRTITAGLRARF